MAKYTITHTCGHTSEQALYGKDADRQYRIKSLSKEACWNCQKAAKLEAAVSVSTSLPTLTGSDKQIAWATTIRAEFIASAETQKAKFAAMVTGNNAALEMLEGVYNALIMPTEAKHWIDNRSENGANALYTAMRSANHK